MKLSLPPLQISQSPGLLRARKAFLVEPQPSQAQASPTISDHCDLSNKSALETETPKALAPQQIKKKPVLKQASSAPSTLLTILEEPKGKKVQSHHHRLSPEELRGVQNECRQ